MPRSGKGGKPTIRDVAALAGVSQMTVSRSIHDPGLVAARTREQVQQAIQELGYIPDLAAGNLASQKSTMVAVVLPYLHIAGHSFTINSLSKALAIHGYHIVLGDNFQGPEEEVNLLRVMLGRRPAGLVLLNCPQCAEAHELLQRSDIPIVETWHLPDKPIDSVVGFSHVQVGIELAEHLITQGFSRIAFIGGTELADPRGERRRQGYVSALQNHGLDASRQIILDGMPLDMTAGRVGVDRLLEQYPDTDAVICLNDRIAFGGMMECAHRQIDIPGRLAFCGHGDFDYSEHLVPSLTTSRIDARKIGRLAADLLIRNIRNRELTGTDQPVDVGFQVVARESTARQP